MKYAEAQTEWIVDNEDERDIEFVTHVGDLVNNGWREVEWDRIESILDPLDGEVPYSTVDGNHDREVKNDKSSSIEEYRQRFGESRFSDRDWYGETGPYGLSSYQTFTANGNEFLHLGLKWEPEDEVLDWAENVVSDYEVPTLLTTHSHMRGGFLNRGRTTQVVEEEGRGNHGEHVFQELISPNSEIFMDICGHSYRNILSFEGGEHHQTSYNNEGEPVYEMLANFQGRSNGGNGFMRNIIFAPGEGHGDKDRIYVTTYSPFHDRYQLDSNSNLRFDLDFEERLDYDYN